MSVSCKLYLGEVSLTRIIVALKAAGEPEDLTLAGIISGELEDQRKLAAKQTEAAEALAQLRASRAASHKLTKRQAELLASLRAGKGPYGVPYSWEQEGVRKWSWRHARSMGGAVGRMVDVLIDEGLLDSRRQLTDAGRLRLEGYEQKRGHVGP